MTPIKWSGSAWVDTTESDTDWYNYTTTDKKWANARSADGSMWVWIPRYIYKISTGWHSNTAGTIDIQFSKGLDDNWNKAVIGNINLDQTANASNNTWTNHPSFTFGDIELTGFWISKFEASSSNPAATNGGGDVTNLKVKSVPNVVSWRGITLNNSFIVSRAMETDNTYGWGTTGVGIDTHLVKNIEWGATAYLSKSLYGKNTEVWVNNSSTFTTGCAGASVSAASYAGCENTYNTTNGVQASTTGNIYGAYDMSGGSNERSSSYINNGNANLINYGSSIISATSKYSDAYISGTPDNVANDYALAISHKGDATYEISNNTNGAYAWHSDHSYIPNTTYPWFLRGGHCGQTINAGPFYFGYSNGSAANNYSFRATIVIDQNL
jgi:hypothetical protein